MIEAKTYRGIDFIRIKELPQDQKQAIKNWLNPELIIKIQTETSLLSDCILYKDYKDWFEKIYTSAVSGETEKANAELNPKRKPLTGLAFD